VAGHRRRDAAATEQARPNKPYLQRGCSEGCTNAFTLHREIAEQGHPDGCASVRDFGEILTCHLGALFPDWIDTVVRTTCPD
jgi:hypothetical protein